MTELSPFHIAFPVHDLDAARHFYGTIIGCAEGRSDTDWIDFDLYGHQIVAHRVAVRREAIIGHNSVDAHAVPVPHFGVVLPPADWRALADRLVAANVEFVIEPTVRFAGEPGEQSTMFFLDPSGNALEFKSFRDVRQLFAK
ncbi:MAG: VOC family protein [Pseudomonadota bacterium]|jgi:uncharacterized protein